MRRAGFLPKYNVRLRIALIGVCRETNICRAKQVCDVRSGEWGHMIHVTFGLVRFMGSGGHGIWIVGITCEKA